MVKNQELFTDGGVSGEGQMKDGKRHGIWTFYYKNGSVQAMGKYLNGEFRLRHNPGISHRG